MDKDQILQIFRDYLSGKMRLSNLEDWILSHIQGILNSGDQEAIAMIDQVDAFLIEIGVGVASEKDILNAISGFVANAETIERDLYSSDISLLSIDQGTEDDLIAPTSVIAPPLYSA